MASMTLAEARALIQEHLDEDSTLERPQWSTTQIDTALRSALSSCLAEYVRQGGNRFEEHLSLSSTSGSLDLSSYSPLDISGVGISIGSTRFPVPAARAVDISRLDTDSRTVIVTLTRNLEIPTTTTHPLIGIGATEVNSVPMFANWVCLRAARQLYIKEGDRSSPIEAMEATARQACMGAPRIGGNTMFPTTSMYATGRFAYYYDSRNQTLKFGYR